MKTPEFYNDAISANTQKSYGKGRIGFLFPISLAVTSLMLGCSIYLLSRDTSNFLYRFSVYTGFRSEVDFLREWIPALPSWFVYSLPDGLWMFSFSILILMIWDFHRTRKAMIWIALALSIGILLEGVQATTELGGSFDWRDLGFILFAPVLPLCLTHPKSQTQ